MLSVFFDHQIFTLQKFGGISRYFVDLATGLRDLRCATPKIVSGYHFNHYLSLSPRAIRIPSLFLPYSSHRIVNRCLNPAHNAYISAICKLTNPHIVHHTYYLRPCKQPSGTPSVITVYDMINEKFPQYFPNNHITLESKRQAIYSSDHIICISKTTLNDLLEIYPSVENKASCVYIDVPKPKVATLNPVPHGLRPYILYVGHRKGYKNFDILLRSFLASKELHENYDLLAFGGPPLTPAESAQILSSGVNPNSILQLSGPDTQLYELLSSAQCLVYPSLYEGFGIPPIEAMHLGCPVVASYSSCLPEVLSNAALYFDPSSIRDITNVLLKILNSSSLRHQLVHAGYNQASLYDNGNMIRRTANIYHSLI